jgi:hypothetical protein
MSIQHGNRGVVKKDLQLYYNREYNGSFLGEPTVNFFSIPAYTLQKEGNHATSFATSTSSGVPDLVVSGNKQVYYVSEYYTLVATGAWVAESNRLIIYPKHTGVNSSFPPAGTYRISFYARSLSGNTNLGFAFYGNSINNTAILTSKWQRFSANSTNGGAMIIEFGNLNAGSMVCQIACIQVEAKSYATPFTVPVLWTPNLVGVTSTSGHTTMTKNIGDSWVNSRVYSSEGYNEPCYVSFKANATNKAFMVALNSDPLTGINYSNLDYAWYCTDTADSKIYESNVDRGSAGSYTTSSIFEIIYDGANISYYRDGGLARTVARTGSGPLYLDSSFFSLNSQIVNLSFGPLSQINRFSNYVIGGGGLKDISGNNVNADLTNVLFNSSGYYFNAASSTRIIAKTYTATDTFWRNLGAISIWFKTSTNQNGVLVGWGDDGNTNFGSIQITADWTGGFADESLIAESNNATASQRAVLRKGANYYANGIWNNVTAVFDDNYLNLMIYINGVLETTSNNGSSSGAPFLNVSTSTSYFNIGRRTYGAGTEYFTGEIGQVLVYGKILTAAEVLQNFNATRKTYGL